MRLRTGLAALAGSALILMGIMFSTPFDSVAQQEASPTSGTEGDATSIVGTPLLEPAIDLLQAQRTALEGNPDAVVVSVDLDGDTGVLAYSIQLDSGTEVEIDATTGEILSTEQNTGDDDDHENDGHDDGHDDENEGDD